MLICILILSVDDYCNATVQVLESQLAGLAWDALWKVCVMGSCRHIVEDNKD